MSEFKSLDTYTIPGIGKVFVVENDIDRDPENNLLTGNVHTIDGAQYKIRRTESHLLPKIYKGEKIGLLV